MKLDGIEAFVAAVETGSISEAARRLRLSKSVVSERLAELERSLGVKLLQRSTRKLSLTEDGAAFPNLPLVVGDDAGEYAMVMTRAMDAYPALKEGLVALSRIGDRRWDMIYSSGVRIQLPELGVAQALAQLSTLEAKYQLLERDVEVIDLRVPGIIAVQPSAAAQQQLAAIYKADVAKNKVKFNQDADYTAPSH